jgi:hypothetical protein
LIAFSDQFTRAIRLLDSPAKSPQVVEKQWKRGSIELVPEEGIEPSRGVTPTGF